MSRALRQKQLSMINSLENANRALKEAVIKTVVDEEGVLQLLADCQDTAIFMGNAIENVYGEGTRSVSCLEEYCEGLYEMTLAIGNSAQRREKLKMLTGQLKRVRRAISDEIPDRLEVVFLPYKASMWDSLESVWKAAHEDEVCDAYVIPIPYYDKNPDGSFHEMHYEGEDYPDYVPITYYQEYDFAARHPDMIFIHNPYDEYNYVTSVEPFFYSKNLRNFTDKLVYIPYFILGDMDPENQTEIDKMSHFCTVPGVIQADKVIVESENMRQIYINELLEHMDGTEIQRKYLENKILGLGSPKTDKVLATRKENVEVPDEWLRVIQKGDGSWKKIIFYNVSVSAALSLGDKLLTKMESVFQIFEDKQDEVALLWRPHPLFKATIESMVPELWGKYNSIVKRYREAGWGIYDDTPDMERAMALCDAYYGDWSSIVHLCRQAGKPVMIQNMEIV